MCQVHLILQIKDIQKQNPYFLVSICEILVEQVHRLVDLEEYVFELLELFGVRSVCSHSGYFFSEIKHSLEFGLEIFPQRVAYYVRWWIV